MLNYILLVLFFSFILSLVLTNLSFYLFELFLTKRDKKIKNTINGEEDWY